MIRLFYILMNWLTIIAGLVGVVWLSWIVAKLLGRQIMARIPRVE